MTDNNTTTNYVDRDGITRSLKLDPVKNKYYYVKEYPIETISIKNNKVERSTRTQKVTIFISPKIVNARKIKEAKKQILETPLDEILMHEINNMLCISSAKEVQNYLQMDPYLFARYITRIRQFEEEKLDENDSTSDEELI